MWMYFIGRTMNFQKEFDSIFPWVLVIQVIKEHK